MSEFSDAYFLFGGTCNDAASLLKRIHRHGFVLPVMGRYVPFFADDACDAGQIVEAIIEHNPGTLLHYAYASDHGLRLTAFDGSRESFVIDLQRRGPSLNDTPTIVAEAGRLGMTTDETARQLEGLLTETALDGEIDLEKTRARLGDILGVHFIEWFGCADLTALSLKDILERFPEGKLVLKNRRGKALDETRPTPNQWCPKPGLPGFMYLAVPDGDVDVAMVERHVRHWMETSDFDVDRQAGFWMYNAYYRALPSRMRYLANRVMNLMLVFGPVNYEKALRRTIRGILAVVGSDFDWEPYLARKKGEQRL